jgi:microcystin degradation protein MlrC
MGETVLIGQLYHETNTFASSKTTRADFRDRREHFGEAIFDVFAETNTELGGFLDAADSEGTDLIPTVAASAVPGGVVSADAYEYYVDRILDSIVDRTDELDGIVLSFHGAMVPEGRDKGEGPLLSRIRDEVGPDVPLAVTLDLHGNLSDAFVQTVDILVSYETYPHVDMGETGRRAMSLLLETVREEIDPVTHVERPPVLPFGPKQNTRSGPMADVMEVARELERDEDILKVNVLPGFQGADIPAMGFSVPVLADDDSASAREAARDVAEFVWRTRRDFVGDYPDATTAVETATHASSGRMNQNGPVVLADVGDNPGSGAPADGTIVLRELLDQRVANAGLAIIRDPTIVEECITAGVGERVVVTLGGKTDDLHGSPIRNLDGYVKSITDGRYVNRGQMERGAENNLGRTVLLRCGPDDGIAVIVSENRLQPYDTEIWRHVGIQPEELSILVVKSKNHFRADYEPIASDVIAIDTPGLGTLNPSRYPYERARRPKFPIDEMPETAYPDW